MTMRKLACSFLITIIISMSFLIPIFKVSTFYSYAALDDDQYYEPLRQQSDLVKAFQAYCKSRDLTIEGSAADAVTTWTTSAFNKACNNVGINITQIQAEIKAQYDELGRPTKYFFNSVGVGLMNRVFAQFLQDNELEVGEAVDNKTVFDGMYYTYDNHTALCFQGKISTSWNDASNITVMGSPYIYDAYTLAGYAGSSVTIPYDQNNILNYNVYHSFGEETSTYYENYSMGADSSNGNYTFLQWYKDRDNSNGRGYLHYIGYPCIFYNNGKFWAQRIVFELQLGTSIFRYRVQIGSSRQLNPQSSGNANIFIYSPIINNVTFEGDTIYYPDGTPEEPEGDPDQPYNPYPDNPNYPPNNPSDPSNPSDPYIPPSTPATDPNNPPSGDGGGTITFPDIDLNLPEINWSLGNLSEKFPFSIPFDLIAFFTVLNASPEAPAIDADIPLGDWYTWHFEADFSQYDNWASLIRNVEFIAFCVGLIYLTVRFVKG